MDIFYGKINNIYVKKQIDKLFATYRAGMLIYLILTVPYGCHDAPTVHVHTTSFIALSLTPAILGSRQVVP